MIKKKGGLGRGLDALLGAGMAARSATSPDPAVETLQQLSVDCIQRGRYQPRQDLREDTLRELAESIRAQGVVQPVVVRPVGEGRYELIAGERRWRAAQLAELGEVPAVIREVSDQAAIAMALIENIQREDLNPLEEAQGVQRLISEFGLNREGAAQAIGRSASAVSNMLRLLNLVEPVQQMLTAGDLDMGHARALLSLDRARQITCAHEIVARKLSVRETERLVNRQHEDEAIRTGAASAAGRTPPPKSRDVLRLEEQLADLLAVPVEIRIRKRTKRGDQGELAISFGSLDDLGALLDRLGITER